MIYSFQYISTLDDMTSPGTQTLHAQKDHFIKNHQLFVFLSIVYYVSVMYIYLR